MATDEKIAEAAFAIFANDWFDDLEYVFPTDADWEYIRNKWVNDFLPTLSQPHQGDCTNEPMACLRCATEECFRMARACYATIEKYGIATQ